MQHRHLNHQNFTPAAVDDIIRRGRVKDWVSLGRAARRDEALRGRIERLCAAAHPSQEGYQRINFWRIYVSRLRAKLG